MLEVDVPNFEAFTGPKSFGVIFDEYEREVLKARNEAIASTTEKYLSAMAKKTQSQTDQREGKAVEKPKSYTIDTELGRLQVDQQERL